MLFLLKPYEYRNMCYKISFIFCTILQMSHIESVVEIVVPYINIPFQLFAEN